MRARLESELSRVPQTRDVLIRMVVAFVITVAITILTSTGVHAQSTAGSLPGQVQIPSTVALAGANVTATSESTGVSLKTVTTSAGTFAFPNLLSGIYTVRVGASSFSSAEVSSLPNTYAGEGLS